MRNFQSSSAHKIIGSQLTASLSVAMVLTLLGFVALAAVAAVRISTAVMEQIGFVIVASDSEDECNSLVSRLKGDPRVANVEYSSARDVLEHWRDRVGNDIDDDLDGVNPFLPEIEVGVKAQWSHPDSLSRFADAVRALPQVEKVHLYGDTARAVRSVMRTLATVGSVLAAILLVISFVLINNTIRLTIYSQRFLIHTMRLVGATAGFIRRPFILQSMLWGVLSAMLASATVVAVTFWMSQYEPDIALVVDRPVLAFTIAGIFAAGIVLSGFGAFVAANRYIKLSLADLYK